MNKTIPSFNPLVLEGNWLIGIKSVRVTSVFNAMEGSYKFNDSSAKQKVLKAIRYFKIQNCEIVISDEIDEEVRPTIMNKF